MSDMAKVLQTVGDLEAEIPRVQKGKVAGAFFAAVIIILTSMVQMFEGKTLVAVQPIPGDVPTICYGETHGVQMGDTATDAECTALLKDRLRIVYNQLAVTIPVPVKPQQMAAFADFVYNEGMGNWMHSDMLKDLNKGDVKQACLDFTITKKGGLLKYDIAQGRHWKGLARRRVAERELCLF